ncbi:MAG: tetratricopeptide repeat protein [Proteobacteria bacterium]|nr:tetratricopeptide repeat protein [Pseudomonadota bacterium]
MQVLAALGAVAKRAARLNAAAALYRKVLRLTPDGVDFRLRLAGVLRRCRRSAEAIKQYEIILSAAPDHFDARFRMAQLLLEAGDRKGALVHLERAVEINPSHPEARYRLGRALRQAGELERAAAHLLRAVEIDSGHAAAHEELTTLVPEARLTPSLIKPLMGGDFTDDGPGEPLGPDRAGARLVPPVERLRHGRMAQQLAPPRSLRPARCGGRPSCSRVGVGSLGEWSTKESIARANEDGH